MAELPGWGDVRRRIKSADERISSLEERMHAAEYRVGDNLQALQRADSIATAQGEHIERIDGEVSDLAVKVGGLLDPDDGPAPTRDISAWTDEFDRLDGVNYDRWEALVDSYSHDARHIIGAYLDLAEVSADATYLDSARALTKRFIEAYDRYPRNRNDDLVKNMVLARAHGALGDEVIREHCLRVLDDVRNLSVGSPSGSMRYRVFSYTQNSYMLSFAGPWGRWQGQGTAVWLLASVADKAWAGDMASSWTRELVREPGVWGATWNESEGLYMYARNTFKAGREVYLIDAGVEPQVFLDAWARVVSRGGILFNVVHQYIDGTTGGDPQRGATQLYDGWVRIGQWSKDMRDVVDYTLKQDSGIWRNLNDGDPARVHRAALLAGRARVEVLR